MLETNSLMSLERNEEGRLMLGGVELAEAVRTVGTPAYVYDLDAIAAEARALRGAFGKTRHLVAYAVKANSAAEIVRTLAREGCGADVVSGAELGLALACGVPAERILYSGVAKRDDELDRAISAGASGIGAIQVESVEEITRIEARAAIMGWKAQVSLRVNPGVDIDDLSTHAHIATGHDDAKFGVPVADLAAAMAALASSPHLALVGLTAHVGSQFTTLAPYLASARALFDVTKEVRKTKKLDYVDTGGGFGIDYGAGCSASPADFVRAALEEKKAAGLDDLALYVEPGRSLVAAHAVLVGRVLLRKVSAARRWVMLDTGMNDLIRPALYQAKHRIELCDRATPATERAAGAADAGAWRVVGPVCESSDDFGEHPLGDAPEGLVAIRDAGAYGYTMASRYNGRALPAEVFIAQGKVVMARARDDDEVWIRDRLAAGRA
jgi:diaminopimelate decarboxylase